MTEFNYERSLGAVKSRILACAQDSVNMSKMEALCASLEDFKKIGDNGLGLAALTYESFASSMRVRRPMVRPERLEDLAETVKELRVEVQKQVTDHLVDLAEMRAYLSAQVKRTMSEAAYLQEKLDRGFQPQTERIIDLRDYSFCELLCIDGKLPDGMKDLPEVIKSQVHGFSATMRVLIQNTSEWIRIHRGMMLYNSKPIEEFCLRQVPTFATPEVLPGGYRLSTSFKFPMGTGEKCLEGLFAATWELSASSQTVNDKASPLCRGGIAESLDQVKRLSLVGAEVFDLFYKEVWSESQVMELLNDIRSLGDNPRVWPLFDLVHLQLHLMTQAATAFAKYICDFCEAYLSYLQLSFEKD